MTPKGAKIFLWMQVFFVVFGFALFFGLKAIKDNQRERQAAETAMARENNAEPFCDFSYWVGLDAKNEAIAGTLKELGRPYRIVPPGAMVTMDFNSERINLYTDEQNQITGIKCG